MVTLRNFNAVLPDDLQKLADNPSIAQNLRDVFPHPYTIEDAQFFLELVEQHKVWQYCAARRRLPAQCRNWLLVGGAVLE